ncbi:MAG: maltose alpha-D-glucosyltransferase [Desulfovibrionaceae bacterium]|nr:maltose alpha-D-glucosyltransferase [Desulfovibrionaceae bacterium]
MTSQSTPGSETDAQWYKDAVIYELHVKAFMDANGDGIGDFAGLTSRLDHLERLGVTAIWLLPFYPSPRRDDGYDIADYRGIHPDYGTLADFKSFLRAAHARGMKVITELVLNHTSDQHPWFQAARKAKPGSAARDFYVFSDTPDHYPDARIIFKDFEHSNWTFDHEAKAYYWHRFYSHQPDLNFDNPRVKKEMLRILDFWLSLGVDGLRLDAVPYLFERDGTNCENLPETHAFLRELRAHVDAKYPGRMLLAEANQWPEDAAAYFGAGHGDECNMAFHFPIMPRIFMSLMMEDRFPLLDIFEQTPAIPETSQWAMFLRNHDELTLEMVSDEERDYMYRVYAKDARARINLGIRRRLAPLMQNNRRRLELINFILFSFPGTPIVYYGDEIGMGDNFHLGDRDGVRTPMQWSPDKNAGFSRANPHSLYLPVVIDPEYHYQAVNVENQERNLTSFLWWMRRVIAMRKRLRCLGRGGMEFVRPDNPKVLSFIRRLGDEIILVVVNLSRYPQVAEMDLSAYAGYVPVEVFGNTPFPVVRETPYVLPMGFHSYFWFRLTPPHDQEARGGGPAETRHGRRGRSRWTPPEVELPEIEGGEAGRRFRRTLAERVLPVYLPRLFPALRALLRVEVSAVHALAGGGEPVWLVLAVVHAREGVPVTLPLLLTLCRGEAGTRLAGEYPGAVAARVESAEGKALLVNGFAVDAARAALFSAMTRWRRPPGDHEELTATPLSRLRPTLPVQGTSRFFRDARGNMVAVADNAFALKCYARVEPGPHHEAEMLEFLAKTPFKVHVPAPMATLSHSPRQEASTVLALLAAHAPGTSPAFDLAAEGMTRALENVLASGPEAAGAPPAPVRLRTAPPREAARILARHLGHFHLEMLALLGTRTAQLHLALASDPADDRFAPEPFSLLYQRSAYQSMRNLAKRTLAALRGLKSDPDGELAARIAAIADRERDILAVLSRFAATKFLTAKTRLHGDLTLSRVLYTGKDFLFGDFEGDPDKPVSERRIKRSPLRDVAGMSLSMLFAANASAARLCEQRQADAQALAPWVEPLAFTAASAFWSGYREAATGACFVPASEETLWTMFHCFLLEHALGRLAKALGAGLPEELSVSLSALAGIMRALEQE